MKKPTLRNRLTLNNFISNMLNVFHFVTDFSEHFAECFPVRFQNRQSFFADSLAENLFDITTLLLWS